MLLVDALKSNNAIETKTLLGSGMRASAIDAGMCVKTIALIKPMRFARAGAAKFDAEARSIPTKNRVPIVPSASRNLRL